MQSAIFSVKALLLNRRSPQPAIQQRFLSELRRTAVPALSETLAEHNKNEVKHDRHSTSAEQLFTRKNSKKLGPSTTTDYVEIDKPCTANEC